METYTITVTVECESEEDADEVCSEISNALQDADECGELPEGVSFDVGGPELS